MSRTESAMVDLGTIAPAFELVDVLSGRALSRDDVFALSWDDGTSDTVNTATHGGPQRKHGLLVMFLCVHCPYVKHVEQELARLARDYAGENGEGPIAIAAIQSNDIAQFPDDGPDGMREQAERLGWNFPTCLTKPRRSRAATAPLAHPTSSSSTERCGWCIAASSMPAVPDEATSATTSRSPALTFDVPSMQ